MQALFTGPAGTGKTLAAPVVAVRTRLTVIRMDLTLSVRKHIGKTENNPARLRDRVQKNAPVHHRGAKFS